MARTMIRWVRRLVVVAVVGAIVGRVVARLGDNDHRVERHGSGALPAIGGDTWPPVPTNPERPG